MARGLAFEEGGFYHVYNRGTDKRAIFNWHSDYERFIMLLYLANSTKAVHVNDSRGSTSGKLFQIDQGDQIVDICAYCLMPNHFHLLLHERTSGGISHFMQKLSTAYTMYFNAKNERTGALFEGKFKARDANEDRYLKYLLAYIHLNPAKLINSSWKDASDVEIIRTKQFLDIYPFSSYMDFCGKIRPETSLLTKNALPAYFDTPEHFQTNIIEWLHYRNEFPRASTSRSNLGEREDFKANITE
jgi:putative transposase